MNKLVQFCTEIGNQSLPIARLMAPEFSAVATCKFLLFLSKFVNDYADFSNHRISGKAVESLQFRGINFPTRVGIAAGLDKNGEYVNGLGLLGPGFIEIGSVLSKPWSGNSKPRLWRLASTKGLVNSLGLPSAGIDKVLENLKKTRWNGVVGINIAKHPKQTQASFIEVIATMLEQLNHFGDYFTINLSCPNTDDKLAMQDKNYQHNLFFAIAQFNAKQTNPKPIFIKIAPVVPENSAQLYTWPDEQLSHLRNMMDEFDISGVIVTNSIPDARLYRDNKEYNDEIQGGVSGKPVAAISEALLDKFRPIVPKDKLLISCGGVISPQDVQRRLEKGADLVQVYTGLIYSGKKLFNSFAQ